MDSLKFGLELVISVKDWLHKNNLKGVGAGVF